MADAIHRPEPAQEVVRTRRIEILDDSDRVRIVIGEQPGTSTHGLPAFGIALAGPNGSVKADLWASPFTRPRSPAARRPPMPGRRRYGSVRRLPSGRWQARYYDAAGNRYGAPATFATKGDAQRWLSAAETDMGRGEWHDPRLGDVPLREWAERWLITKAPKLQPSTVDLYRYLLHRYVVPRFGTAAIGRITPVDVQAWLADLHGTHLSPNTVAKAYRVLNGVMDGAVDAHLIARSPCTIRGAGTERHDEIQDRHP